ncbi:unnamed protein product, partial [Ranitomeya imitator]
TVDSSTGKGQESEEEDEKASLEKEAFFALEFLLDNNADPSFRDKQGYAAVHYAAAFGNRQNLELAYNGHCDALKTLAETLVNLDVRDHKGRTAALYLATERGFTECVEVLMSHRASPLIKDRKKKWTPLHVAAASGNTDVLHLLIDSSEKPDITDVMDAHGQTPLMLAVMNGHVDCVHLLLEKGATVDAGDKRGRTTLHRASVTGCEDCVGALLDHDAFVLCRDYKGRTPIHFASACGHATLVHVYLQAALSTDPLDAVVDYNGYTPMHWAAYNGHEDCLELLLEHNPFAYLEGNPFTPLHCAVINSQDGTAEMLITALGAKIVNSRDAKGRDVWLASVEVREVVSSGYKMGFASRPRNRFFESHPLKDPNLIPGFFASIAFLLCSEVIVSISVGTLHRFLFKPACSAEEQRRSSTHLVPKLVNKRFRLRHFRMESLCSVLACMEPQEFLCSIDIQEAYLDVLIFPAHLCLLRFVAQKSHFQFIAVPLGLATAPSVFIKIMATFMAILRIRGLVLIPYLEDIKTPPPSQAQESDNRPTPCPVSGGWRNGQFSRTEFSARPSAAFLPFSNEGPGTNGGSIGSVPFCAVPLQQAILSQWDRLLKIIAEGVPVFLTAPDWPRRFWFAEIANLLADFLWRPQTGQIFCPKDRSATRVLGCSI